MLHTFGPSWSRGVDASHHIFCTYETFDLVELILTILVNSFGDLSFVNSECFNDQTLYFLNDTLGRSI